MDIESLKSVVNNEQAFLNGASGICTFSKSGPVGIRVIDALVQTIEALEKRVAELEKNAIIR